MIRINCTNCKTLLTIDEAFAGGVCRCQYCGTIQTVPTHVKNGVAAPAGQVDGGKNGGAKTLFENKIRADAASGSGLDTIAEVIASSGLSGSGLSSNLRARKSRGFELPARKNMLVPLLIAAGVVIVILLTVVIYMWINQATRDNSTPSQGDDTSGQSQPQMSQSPTATAVPTPGVASQTPPLGPVPAGSVPPAAPVAAPPNPSFLGVPISEPSVVYLLDSSGATRTIFDPMVQACFRSIESLKSDQKFQVIFWKSDTDVAYPATGLIAATDQNKAAAEEQLKDAYAAGASNIEPSIKKALASHPGVICLATGKYLPREFADMVETDLDKPPVKVNTFSLGQEDSSDSLEKIAKATGGKFVTVSVDDLSTFGQK